MLLLVIHNWAESERGYSLGKFQDTIVPNNLRVQLGLFLKQDLGFKHSKVSWDVSVICNSA